MFRIYFCKMNSSQTMSREQLRNLPATNLKDLVRELVQMNVSQHVISAARKGQKSYLWTRKERDYRVCMPNQSILEISDAMFIEAIQEQFPGTTVEASKEWVEITPGMKDCEKVISIDWS